MLALSAAGVLVHAVPFAWIPRRAGALDANFTSINPDNAYFLQNQNALQAGWNAAAISAPIGPGGSLVPLFSFFNKDWTAQVDSFSEFETEVRRAA